MNTLIKNGHVIDPTSGLSALRDVRIEDGRIAAVGQGLEGGGGAVIDADGLIVCPGLVDIHVHFREPGFESKETIATGSQAAAKGGFTTVVTMPNTNPPIDNGGMVELHNRRARETACMKVLPAACATKGRSGSEMTEMADLKATGAVAVTDDGSDIPSSWVLRRVLEYADMVGLTYLTHAEDHTLMEDGAMNEGFNATRLGLPGMPKAMEEIAIDRAVRLAELAGHDAHGARIHICHISTEGGVDIVRRAKARGLRVSCETAPHYWTLTDDAVEHFGPNAKMNPPLREAADIEAIKAGLADGTIDCIATDHAPHTPTEKDVEFQLAPFGIVGLETALGLAVSGLVELNIVSLERLVELMTWAPAKLLDLPAGTLAQGAPADLCIFDPKAEWTVDPSEFASKSRNTPYKGMQLRGQVRYTLCDGKRIYEAG